MLIRKKLDLAGFDYNYVEYVILSDERRILHYVHHGRFSSDSNLHVKVWRNGRCPRYLEIFPVIANSLQKFQSQSSSRYSSTINLDFVS